MGGQLTGGQCFVEALINTCSLEGFSTVTSLPSPLNVGFIGNLVCTIACVTSNFKQWVE